MNAWWLQPVPGTHAKTGMSLFLGLAHAVLAVGYAWPDSGITRTLLPPATGAVSVVNAIDRFGPWWVVGYGISAIWLLIAVAYRRTLQLAHLFGLVVLGAYSFAIWYGVFASAPNRAWLTAIFASGWCVWHGALCMAYTEAMLHGESRWKP